MARTERRNYRGRPIRDGEWGRRCPDPQCNVCGTGIYKAARVKRSRRQARQELNMKRKEHHAD